MTEGACRSIYAFANTGEPAADGNFKTYFDSPNGWAGLDLGAPHVITTVRFSPRSENTGTTARMFGAEFQGSNDPEFAQAVTLFKVQGTKSGAVRPVWIPESVFNTTSFRYVRLIGNKGKTLVAEIKFYGYAANGN